MDKVQQGVTKFVDWWDKHNISTRTVLITVLILFAATVVLGLLDKAPHNYYTEILHTLSDIVLYITIIIIAGVNGARTILSEILNKKKGIADDRNTNVY